MKAGAALLVLAAFACTCASQAATDVGASITSVPPQLEAPFERAVRAWQAVAERDEVLAAAISRAAGDPRGRHDFTPFGDESLHRYLYPWVRADVRAHSSYLHAPPPDLAEPRPGPSAAPLPAPQRVTFTAYRDSPYAELRTLSIGPEDIGGLFQPNVRRTTGKWYWEALYRRPPIPGVFRSEIGVNMPTPVQSRRPHSSILALPVNLGRTLRGGEVLRFALDLDRSRFHWGIDGHWLGVQDLRRIDGYDNESGGEYAPTVKIDSPQAQVRAKDRFTFNFGASPFRFRLPDGFEPYDLSARDARLAESTRKPRTSAALRTDRFDRAIATAVNDASKRMRPEIALAFRATVNAWPPYRDAACTLTAAYLADAATPPRGSVADPGCFVDFTGALLNRIDELVRNLPPHARSSSTQ